MTLQSHTIERYRAPKPKSFTSYFSSLALHPPPTLSPPASKDGKLTLMTPKHMVAYSMDSFTFSTIGKFVGRRPLLEQLELWVKSSRGLPKWGRGKSSWCLWLGIWVFLFQRKVGGRKNGSRIGKRGDGLGERSDAV
ncbi:hypothetical protein AAC387_Pa09g0710 [Persea americana]